MKDVSKILLQLLRLELMGSGEVTFPEGFCGWKELSDASYNQWVDAVAADGMMRWCDMHPGTHFSIDDDSYYDARREWYGAVFQAEDDSEKLSDVLKTLFAFFREHGVLPVLMKGYGLSFDYPVPSHRARGDIDLFLLRNGAPAAGFGDELVRRELGIDVEEADGKTRHSHFIYRDIPVENHYFIGGSEDIDERRERLENRLVELISTGFVERNGVSVPSANFNAVYLLHHMSLHFTYDNVNLRQLCDWLTFLKAHHGEIDWKLVSGIWREAGMERFAGVVNDMLIRYLGMDVSWVPEVDVDEKLSARFANEVMEGGKKSGKWLDNVLYYPRSAWKFRLTGKGCWVKLLLQSIRSHIFRIFAR